MCLLRIYESYWYDFISPAYEEHRNIYFCIKIGNVTSYFIMLWLVYGHIQIWSTYEFKNVMRYSNLKVWRELLETMCETYPFLNNACSHFTKTIWFFYGKIMDLKYVSIPNCRIFLTKLRYYCNYYVVILRKEFELSLINFWIFHLSPRHGI